MLPDAPSLLAASSAFMLVLLAEMGDKTQLAIMGLAAKYNSSFPVALTVAFGFAVLSLVAVALGKCLSRMLPIALIRRVAAITFLAVGVILILGIF